MNTHAATPTGYVVSDLHIFSSSSLYSRYIPNFIRAVQQHAVVVLNGDTFDFKRSIYSSSAETTKHAIDWLDKLCLDHPQTTFYYLIGNHDCHLQFLSALKEQLSELANLTVIPDALKLGDKIFIHGDVVDLPAGCNDLAKSRARYAQAEPSLLSKLSAEVITRLRLNLVEYLRHSNQRLAAKILSYLDFAMPDFRQNTREIFFGHTHVPIRHFEYDGIIFHNTGSLVRGLTWMPMEFD
ncbi:MAG: metallophosphoesterase [Pseudomonadota bacterium]|jgi:UDP-2,3-diacylglucosamine pyrophosphatase LpxH